MYVPGRWIQSENWPLESDCPRGTRPFPTVRTNPGAFDRLFLFVHNCARDRVPVWIPFLRRNQRGQQQNGTANQSHSLAS